MTLQDLAIASNIKSLFEVSKKTCPIRNHQASLKHTRGGKGYVFHAVYGIGIILFSFFLQIQKTEAQIPLNPFSPKSAWPESHGVYCQQNSPVASLTESDSIEIDTIRFPQGQEGFIPGGAVTSDFYGNSNIYCLIGCNGTVIYKLVCAPEKYVLLTKKVNEIGGGSAVSFYGLMDKNNYGYFMSDYKLFVIKDSIKDDPYSPIVVDTVLDLSPFKSNDNLRGIKMLYGGQLVVTSTHGNVIVVDRSSKRVLYSLNLHENIINNMASDEGNNVYLNTNRALYKFHWENDSLKQVWAVNMGISGTTPTLIGSCSQKSVEQVVAVIDRSHPMNLILVWKDSIPSGWEALKGRPLRIAAVQPITFNTETPAMDVSPDENSVVVQDNSILLVRYNKINPAADVFRPGLEKWTWIPSLKQLCRNWLNTSTYLPNAMQALSTSVGYFYSIGEKLIGKEKYWTFEGNDWLTGESKIQKVLGPHNNPVYNTYAAGISFGPKGEVITMSREMIFIFKKANKK